MVFSFSISGTGSKVPSLVSVLKSKHSDSHDTLQARLLSSQTTGSKTTHDTDYSQLETWHNTSISTPSVLFPEILILNDLQGSLFYSNMPL